jgi:hypothetical protein
MAGKLLTGGTLASVVTAVALFAGVSSASASGSTFCNDIGSPSTTQTVGVPGVFHVTVMTCNNAPTPPPPPCSMTVEQPHVFHVTVFACTVTATASSWASSLASGGSISVPVAAGPLIAPGTQPQPADCPPALTVNETVAGISVLACVATS